MKELFYQKIIFFLQVQSPLSLYVPEGQELMHVAPEATRVDKQLRHVEELLHVTQLLFNVLQAIWKIILKQKSSLESYQYRLHYCCKSQKDKKLCK